MGNSSCKQRPDISSSIITIREGIDNGVFKEVSDGLTKMGVQSVNLIIGVCFTRKESWTAADTNFHLIDEGGSTNNYERVIFLVGKTIKDLHEDNAIRCFGFGDATTNTSRIFRFYAQEIPCPGFVEAARQYNRIARYARLSEQVSYGPIIRKAICIASAMRDKHHVLVIIGSEPVARSRDNPPNILSVDEQNTINAIETARNYRLSIVLVGVGETNENMMRGLRNRITGADNFKFVDYTQIMSTATTAETLQRQRKVFCLAVFENLPTEITERLHVLSNPAPEVPTLPPPIPPPA